MNITKMIASVEKMKTVVASMRKEVEAERKRVEKIEAARAKLRQKLEKKSDALQTVIPVSAKNEAKVKKLTEQIDALLSVAYVEEDLYVGNDHDHSEDSILGAVKQLGDSLDDLVMGKGKERCGSLVSYEQALAKSTK